MYTWSLGVYYSKTLQTFEHFQFSREETRVMPFNHKSTCLKFSILSVAVTVLIAWEATAPRKTVSIAHGVERLQPENEINDMVTSARGMIYKRTEIQLIRNQ